MTLNTSPNINYLWTNLIVEELLRNGVDYFCVAPGSRSAPLALAVAGHKKARSIVHFDERGLGFHALGYASATGKPCTVITTSGTAVANLLPAVIEASKKKLPLIILTADRPPELRHTGAHQTIDQVGIFGKYVRWFVDLPCPTMQIAPNVVLTTVDQAVFRARGELKGPVHINCMFREPLAPSKEKAAWAAYLKPLTAWQKSNKPLTQYEPPKPLLSGPAIKELSQRIKKIRNGIIAVGKLANNADRTAVLALAEKLQWPVFADISSGLRLGSAHPNVIHYFDQILATAPANSKTPWRIVDGILHCGGRMTSKRFYAMTAKLSLNEYIMVLNHPLRNDPFHQVTARVQMPVGLFSQAIIKHLPARKSAALLQTLQQKTHQYDRTIEAFLLKDGILNEFSAARIISQTIPKDTGLFLSNSLPVRAMDMFAAVRDVSLTVSGNRGASGIDGIIATTAGFAQGLNRPVTLMIGDLAALHDLNSLAMLRRAKTPVAVILLNNDGGGIFSFLPVAQTAPAFEKYFGTPHGLRFATAAEMFDLNYANPQTAKEFIKTYRIALESPTATLIEVTSRRVENVRIQKALHQKIRSSR